MDNLLQRSFPRKKLLVLSDTHGHIPALEAVLKWAQSSTPELCSAQGNAITTAVFLGDGLDDLSRAAATTGFFCDWKLIRGNNDYGHSTPEAAVFDFEEHRFFICHGHRYALYNGYHTLVAAARNAGADTALFGHSHVPFFKNEKDVLLINPGSIGRPRSRIGASFAVIDCIPGKPLEAEFFGIGARGEIREIKI
ncbi:MAG: metallophosphoesterase [Treponema sp.]|jgi:putative phosphoesterase|nr:metallophosphoesterase [Treponema sp.]